MLWKIHILGWGKGDALAGVCVHCRRNWHCTRHEQCRPPRREIHHVQKQPHRGGSHFGGGSLFEGYPLSGGVCFRAWGVHSLFQLLPLPWHPGRHLLRAEVGRGRGRGRGAVPAPVFVAACSASRTASCSAIRPGRWRPTRAWLDRWHSTFWSGSSGSRRSVRGSASARWSWPATTGRCAGSPLGCCRPRIVGQVASRVVGRLRHFSSFGRFQI